MLSQAAVPHEVQVARVDEEMIKASLIAEGAHPVILPMLWLK